MACFSPPCKAIRTDHLHQLRLRRTEVDSTQYRRMTRPGVCDGLAVDMPDLFQLSIGVFGRPREHIPIGCREAVRVRQHTNRASEWPTSDRPLA